MLTILTAAVYKKRTKSGQKADKECTKGAQKADKRCTKGAQKADKRCTKSGQKADKRWTKGLKNGIFFRIGPKNWLENKSKN